MNITTRKLKINNKNIQSLNTNDNITSKRIKKTKAINPLLNRKLNNCRHFQNKKSKINEYNSNNKNHINNKTELENFKFNNGIPSNRETSQKRKKFSRRTIIIDKPPEDSNISKAILLRTLSKKTNKVNKNDKTISTTDANNPSERTGRLININSYVINPIKYINNNTDKIKQKHATTKCNVFFNNLQTNNDNIKSLDHTLSDHKRKIGHKRIESMGDLKYKCKELLNDEDLIRTIKNKNLEYFSNSSLRKNEKNTNTYNNYFSMSEKQLEDPESNMSDIINIENKLNSKIDINKNINKNINKKLFTQNRNKKNRKSSDFDTYNFETDSEIEEKLNREKYIIIIQTFYRGYLGRKFIRYKKFLIFLEKYIKRICLNKLKIIVNYTKNIKNDKNEEEKEERKKKKKEENVLQKKENINAENKNNDNEKSLENKFEKILEENKRIQEEFEIMKNYMKKFDNIILEQNKQNNYNKNCNTEKNENIFLKDNLKIEKNVINLDFIESPTKNNEYNILHEKYKQKILTKIITKKIFNEKNNIQKFFYKLFYATKYYKKNSLPNTPLKSCFRHNNSICIPNAAKNKVYFLMENYDNYTPEQLQQLKRNKILRDIINNRILELKECLHVCFRNFYYRGVLIQMKYENSTKNLPQVNLPKKEENNDELYENVPNNNEKEETPTQEPQELRLSLMKQNKEYEERIRNLNKARGLRKLLSKKNKEKMEILRKYFFKFQEALLICTIKRETRRKTVYQKLVKSEEFKNVNENEIKEAVEKTEFTRGGSVNDFQKLVRKILEEKQMEKKEKEIKVEKEKKNEEIKNNKLKYLQKFVYQVDRQNKIKLKKAFEIYYLKSKVLSLAALPSLQENVQMKNARRKKRRKSVQMNTEKIHKLFQENMGMSENDNKIEDNNYVPIFS